MMFFYVLLLILLILSAVKVVSYFLETYESKKQAQTLSNEVTIWDDTTTPENKDTETDHDEVAQIPESIDFDKLLEENKDVIAWLYCPDTSINYPVVQAKDNDYYLHLGLDREYQREGTLFAECKNASNFTDWNTIIYGHNMKNGTMFHDLIEYNDESFYDEHPVMYLYVLGVRYQIELIAGAVVDTDSDIYSIPKNSEGRDDILEIIRKKSTFTSDVEVREDDKIITLSTCSYEYEDARYVVVGKLTEW